MIGQQEAIDTLLARLVPKPNTVGLDARERQIADRDWLIERQSIEILLKRFLTIPTHLERMAIALDRLAPDRRPAAPIPADAHALQISVDRMCIRDCNYHVRPGGPFLCSWCCSNPLCVERCHLAEEFDREIGEPEIDQ
jgi:hypothetical protein